MSQGPEKSSGAQGMYYSSRDTEGETISKVK